MSFNLSKFFTVPFKIIKSLIIFVVSATALLTAVVIGGYFYFATDMPDIRSISDYHPPVISEVYADDGTKIGEFWSECRIFTPYEKIPPLLTKAFLDAEDANFFTHKGVDFGAIVRAMIRNIRSGRIKEGGSTITQQLTRSLLLSREKTYARKAKEAILAMRLERYLDKKQILTLYLNQIYLGNRAYGVAAAARNYFHKSLDELNLAEISLIAGLPSAPHAFSPIVNPHAARQRQIHVIQRMLEEGDITKKQAKDALSTTVTIYKSGTDKDINFKTAPYFVEHIRRLLKSYYGDEQIYTRGLKVYTTLNLAAQKAAESALKWGVEALDRRQGYRGPNSTKKIFRYQEDEPIHFPENPQKSHKSTGVKFVVGENYDATVVAFEKNDTKVTVSGAEYTIPQKGIKWARPFSTQQAGYDDANYISDPRRILKNGDKIIVRYEPDETFSLSQIPDVQGGFIAIEPKSHRVIAMVGGYDPMSEFNRVTQALRQPGSSYKPFIYSAALDKGYTFKTMVNDSPVAYPDGIGRIWSPKNYKNEYKGPTSFHSCLVFSKNVPTVKIAHDIGTHYLTAYTRKFGISTNIYKYLSMALGANAITLEELANAYTVFPNYGKYDNVVYITKIVDSEGNILKELTPIDDARTTDESSGIRDAKINKVIKMKTDKGGTTQALNMEEDLNQELFSREIHSIKNDNLLLSPNDIKALYGKTIPDGYVISPQTAYLMVNLMQDVVKMGTGARVRELGRPVAGKTGTTNDETDAWFIGFTPDLAAGVWVGFDDIKPIGRGEQGGRTAAPIFLKFMKEALKDRPIVDFQKPEGFPDTKDIASLSGGSAIAGAKSNLEFPGDEGGSDRSGRFFEKDLEEFE